MKPRQPVCHIHMSQPQNSFLTPPLTLAAPLSRIAPSYLPYKAELVSLSRCPTSSSTLP